MSAGGSISIPGISEEDPEMGAEETQTWYGERGDGLSGASPSLGLFLLLSNVGA